MLFPAVLPGLDSPEQAWLLSILHSLSLLQGGRDFLCTDRTQAAATLPSSAPGRFPSPLVWPLCHHSHIRTESNTKQQTRRLFHSMVLATSARHSRRTVYSAILLLTLVYKRQNTRRLLLAFGVFFQDENFDVFQKKNTDPCCVL